MGAILSHATAGRFLDFYLYLFAKTLADTVSVEAEVIWSSAMHLHLLIMESRPTPKSLQMI